MGMGIAFDEDQADFSEAFSPNTKIKPYIGEIGQKGIVKVDEKGTTAVVVSISISFAKCGTPYFAVDRPFFFAIQDDKIGTILFMGSIYDPKPGAQHSSK